MKTVKFFTHGCKVNQYETQALREDFLRRGYCEAGKSDTADVCVINTCTVTAEADRQSLQSIRRAHRLNAGSEIVIAGCLLEKDRDLLKKQFPSAEFLSNKDKPYGITSFHQRNKAFVKIQDGCSFRCSYCKVPLVRGPSRSREEAEIINEVRALSAAGFKEIILCGICLGAWGGDLKRRLSFADLLKKLEALSGNFRIRLSSIEPQLITTELICVVSGSKRICRHFHIPLQSGDDGILKKMNRHYTSADFIALIASIRRQMPLAAVSTDVIVGFPGETEKAFKNSREALRKIQPMRIHVFPFSRREGTAAYDFEGAIPGERVRKRFAMIKDMEKKIACQFAKAHLGKVAEVLIEESRTKDTQLLTGYTDTYLKILIDGPDALKNQLIPAEIFSVTPYSIIGKVKK